MNISIIICTHNRENLLRNVLQSIADIDAPEGCSLELIVADNASTDNTRSLIDTFNGNGKFHVKTLFESKLGKTFALNRAIKNASGDILVFVDDDHIVIKEYLQIIYKIVQENSLFNLFCGRILPKWDGTEPSWVHDSTKYPIRPFPIPNFDLGEKPFEITIGNSFIPGAGNLIVKKAVFERIGLFSEQLGPKGNNLCGGEDIEFVNRALKSGERLLYDPMLMQYHHVDKSRLSLRYVIKKAYLRSMAAYQFEDSPDRSVRLYLVRQAFVRFMRASFSLDKNARRYYLVRFAASLGEIQGRLKSRRPGNSTKYALKSMRE
jgi:glycosyltransferase involved in cell wall biosynthesis